MSILADPATLVILIAAVVLLGMAKGGLAGVGALATPLAALVLPPATAAALLLPILIVQDVISVWSFRKHLDWYVLGWTLPGATVGILIGYLFAASVSAAAVLALVGGISIAFGAYRLWLDRRLFSPRPDYLLKVQGDSTIEDGILDGDLVGVHRTPEARDGQTVVARVDGELTIKRLQRLRRTIRLLPRNPAHAPIEVEPGQDFAIEGVYCGLVRKG